MPGIILDCRYAWSRAPHTSHTQGTPCVRCPCSLQRACCAVHSVARGPSANQEGLALCQAHSRAMVSTLEHPRALYRGHHCPLCRAEAFEETHRIVLPMLQVQVRGCDGQVLPQPSIFIFEVEDLLHHKCSVACSSIPSPQPSFSGCLQMFAELPSAYALSHLPPLQRTPNVHTAIRTPRQKD